MNIQWRNQVVLLTGATGGIGQAIAKALDEKGAHIILTGRSKAKLEQLQQNLTLHHTAIVADITSDEGRDRVVSACQRLPLSILVNNAGTTKFVDHADLEGLSSDDFQNIYGVNVIGAYQMTRAVAEQMKQQEEGGSIVNVASIAGVAGVGSCIAYAASKGAMITMTLSLARVLGPKVRVNVVCPGFIEGEWLKEGLGEERYEQARQVSIKNAPLGVTATSDTVAESILYFIQGPTVVTGESLIIDGGRHLGMTPLTRR